MPQLTHKKSVFFHTALSVLLALCLIGMGPGQVRAEETDSLEYRIKAAYLYNFTKFIVWPEAAFSSADQFTLAIIGDDAFGDTLEPLTQKTVQGRPIHIVKLDNLESIPDLDMLFVVSQEPDEIKSILSAIPNTQTPLTVGESPTFTRSGGMINFYSQKKKIRFEINAKATQQKGFKISSQLLKLARIVNGEVP